MIVFLKFINQSDEDKYNMLLEAQAEIHKLQQENQSLKEKYKQALSILAEYSPPCELDGFMDKNVDYCSMNCGVDEEIFKECWNRYIEQKVKGDKE